MAWTDACKIEAVNAVDHKVGQGMSVRGALKAISKESGIPAATLSSWKYPRKEGVVETYHKKQLSQKTMWKNVNTRLHRLVNYINSNIKNELEIDFEIQGNILINLDILNSYFKGE